MCCSQGYDNPSLMKLPSHGGNNSPIMSLQESTEYWNSFSALWKQEIWITMMGAAAENVFRLLP